MRVAASMGCNNNASEDVSNFWGDHVVGGYRNGLMVLCIYLNLDGRNE